MNFELTEEERSFYATVSRAAFANPFSQERLAADREITGLDGAAGGSLLDAVVSAVEGKVEELRERGRADLRRYAGVDRELVGNFLLFHVFHQYYLDFDRHILQQVAAGDEPIDIDFYAAMVADFRVLGFTAEDIDRYIAVFFQMRRAYYFISTSLVGESASMQRLRSRLWNNVFTHDLALYVESLWNRLEDFSTLLLGETGTGKGLAAAAIGRSGFIPVDRRAGRFRESFTRAFLSIHLSQYPEQLIESELFGHAKGSFTGAMDKHQGIFARSSSRGAVFLDEIGEVPVPIQIKLLGVLQNRTFTPVGSHREERFSGRVIGATNRDVETLLREGKFRADFYYRLSSDVITLPSLRERISEDPDELERLIEHLLTRIVGHAGGGLTEHVRAALQRDLPPGYRWSGNVRELEQGIRRILLNRKYRPRDAGPELDDVASLARGMESGSLTIPELAAGYCRALYRTHPTYQEVARRTGLDRRTVKKYLQG